jgi:hypothetical protein
MDTTIKSIDDRHATTIRLPTDLRRKLRIEAAIRNVTLHQLMLDMLASCVDRCADDSLRVKSCECVGGDQCTA